MRKNVSGFTLVEILVVIVILAILASIVTFSYNSSMAKARDVKRKADVAAIADAIQLYRQKYGNDVQNGSGCGSGDNGNGWFNYASGSATDYTKSILGCLQTAGYLNGGSGNGSYFVDPTGCTVSVGSGSASGSPLGKCKAIGGNYYTYMKYSTGSGDTSLTCVYARLETEDYTSTLTSSSNPCYSVASSTVATSYHMNYEVVAK